MLMHANSLIAPLLSLGSAFKAQQRSSIAGSHNADELVTPCDGIKQAYPFRWMQI